MSNVSGINIEKPNEPKTRVTVFFREPCIFELTVADPEGLFSKDTIKITMLVPG